MFVIETVNRALANVTSLLITLPAPDDPANFNKSFLYMYYLNLVSFCLAVLAKKKAKRPLETLTVDLLSLLPPKRKLCPSRALTMVCPVTCHVIAPRNQVHRYYD